MSDNASPTGDPRDTALQSLLRVVATGDRALTSRLLAKSPTLARLAIKVGATRESADKYYFKEIAHYAYAGDTPLHIAAAAHQRDIAEELVARGANVRARNRRGAEPIHYAADGIPGADAWNPDAQHAVVEYLIKAGGDPNSKDNGGVAPLHRAVRTRCAAAVRALLANGADPVGRSKSGLTPLHLAVQSTGRGGTGSKLSREEQAEIIRLLLRHGARPSDKDSAGRRVKECVKASWIRELLGVD